MVDRQQVRQVSPVRLILEMVMVGIMAIVFAVIVSGLLYWVLGGPQEAALADQAEAEELKEIAAFFGNPIFMFLTLVFGDVLLRQRHVSLRALGFKKPGSVGLTILQGLGLTGLLLVYWTLLWQIYQVQGMGLPHEVVDVYSGDQFRYFYAMTAVAWIASGFGQEVLFRGFYLNNCMELFRGGVVGAVIAVIFQAVLFSFLHLTNTPTEGVPGYFQFFPIFGAGLIMGGAYFLFKRNLWPLIIAHGIMISIYFTLVTTNAIG